LKSTPNALLIIVPRHLERFKRVKSLLNQLGFNSSSRSLQEDVTKDVQVMLGDTMGELNFLYSVSDVAFVGGTLIDHGGQNFLEPAAQGLPLCSGPSLRNFIEISDQLQKASSLKIVHNKEDISNYFLSLIGEKNKLKNTGQASKAVFMENRGAIKIIQEELIKYL
jgi:3-deoxy-D-manno-octulosonic-acid transferase